MDISDNLAGLQKLSLLDYPGKMCCVVFTAGCNFRCPFCHNAALVLGTAEKLSAEEFFAFLQKRRGVLEAVTVSGGEPLTHEGAEAFFARIKEAGYLTKLDTNGSYPGRLRALVEAGLVDYVAMDVKNSPDKYARTAGCGGDLAAVRESVRYLLSGAVDYEFRTTAVAEFHEPDDFAAIARWLAGAKRYYIQSFRDSGGTISAGLHAPSAEDLRLFAETARAAGLAAKLR